MDDTRAQKSLEINLTSGAEKKNMKAYFNLIQHFIFEEKSSRCLKSKALIEYKGNNVSKDVTSERKEESPETKLPSNEKIK